MAISFNYPRVFCPTSSSFPSNRIIHLLNCAQRYLTAHHPQPTQHQLKWKLPPICFFPDEKRGTAVYELQAQDIDNCVEIIENEDLDAASTSYNFLESGKMAFQCSFNKMAYYVYDSWELLFYLSLALDCPQFNDLLSAGFCFNRNHIFLLCFFTGNLSIFAVSIGVAAGILLVFLILFTLVLTKREANGGHPAEQLTNTITTTRCHQTMETPATAETNTTITTTTTSLSSLKDHPSSAGMTMTSTASSSPSGIRLAKGSAIVVGGGAEEQQELFYFERSHERMLPEKQMEIGKWVWV